MECGLLEILLGLVVLLSLYWYTTSGLYYWKKRGVPGPHPLPLFGNLSSVFLKKNAPFQVFTKIYKDYKKYPFVGIYRGRKPTLIINDLDLIKKVLIKEFSTFPGRGMHPNEENEPLSGTLFALDGPRWKHLRTKLTPVFTSCKLKHMCDLIIECSNHLEKYLAKEIGEGRVIECTEPIAQFTTDVIGSCAFGLNMGALGSENSEFRRIGRKIFHVSFIIMMKEMMREASPGLFKFLGLRSSDKQIEDFFISTIRDTIASRERDSIVRHDLVDTLISIKNSDINNEWKITDANLAAQAFVFFAAGFETSSTTISFALLELSHVPKIQEKLRSEILETIEKCNDKITYDIVNEMKYLDMVMQETLRKNPPLTFLSRHAHQSYKVPETEFIIEKGMDLIIPIYAIQRDPEYFPDPGVFNPERFTDKAKLFRHPMTHLPFGDGPKNCIGERFAMYQTKIGLIKILKNYRIKPTELSPIQYVIDISSTVLSTQSGIHLKFERIV